VSAPILDGGAGTAFDGNWYIDEGRRLWASIDLRF